jgi:hypothetical protein
MFFDIFAVLFLVLAMIAGYLTGGFRELLKIGVMVLVFIVFNLPSVEGALKSFAGARLYSSFYIVAFLAAYFIVYQIFFFAFKGLIKAREGALGEVNKTIGVGAGFFKGLFILFIMIYIFDALLTKGVFTELQPFAKDSLIYNLAKMIVDKTGMVFF